MRPLLAHTLVICSMVASMGAAQRPPNSSDSPNPKAKAATQRQRKVVTTPKHQIRGKNHKARRKPAYEIGKATWYGKGLHGQKTASGERYDMFQFTAAHPDLPFGTILKVTNLKNGRWVIVRVTDRGPLSPLRIIDLSYGAAQMLGMLRTGVQRVELDIVEPTDVTLARADIAGIR